MNYKMFYYKDNQMCLLSENVGVKPELESVINDSNNLKIDLQNKTVENLFSFFKENTIKQLLSDSPQLINVDYSEIVSESFYKEDNFIKLLELINSSILKCNSTIENYLNQKREEG